MSADTLSYCTPGMPGFESLVRDQAFREFATITNPTQCKTLLRIQESGKPSISFIASGGVIPDGVVTFSSAGDDQTFAELAIRILVNGDAKDMQTAFGNAFEFQKPYVWELFKQEMSRQFYAVVPAANAPLGMVQFASENPNGVLDLGGAPLAASDMGKLRDMVSPWSPSSPMAYVMHSTTLRELEDSAGSRVSYRRDDRTGVVTPYWGCFRILASDFIHLDELDFPGTSVYFVRFGSGPDDPFGLKSVALVYPEGRPGLQSSALEPRGGSSDLWMSTLHVDYFWDQGQVARAAGISTGA